jgi:two-component system sensor histidine kinase HydH
MPITADSLLRPDARKCRDYMGTGIEWPVIIMASLGPKWQLFAQIIVGHSYSHGDEPACILMKKETRMERRLLILMTAPTVVVGLLLFTVCLVSAWSVNHWQSRLWKVLVQNVTSMEAAQELEINLRKLRFHGYRYLIEHRPGNANTQLLDQLSEDDHDFRLALEEAERSAFTPQEVEYVGQIRAAYQHFQEQFQTLKHRPPPQQSDFEELAGLTPVRPVVEPCERYFNANKEQMNQTRQESERVSRLLRGVLLLLGLVGPVSGLLIGWSMARGLSRSMRSLSVRIQGMAQHLDQEAGVLHVVSEGNTVDLDQQLEQVLQRIQDMVQQLQAQQRELLHAQQLSALGQLAASVAHEIRNPLMSIKMLVEAALRPNKPRPITRDNLQVMEGAVARLEKTVQGFLDFARPPALQRAVCDLRAVASEALNLVRARADKQKVELVLDHLEQPIYGDVDRASLCAVLVNLCLNALDAMPAGGRLTVRLRSTPAEAAVDVLDTGTGISAELVGKLFTPFASSKPTGTGLGLCISKRIIDDHGGRISGSNRPAGGACFTITLPPADISFRANQ